MSWQSISPEVIVKGFLRSAAYPMQWMGLMMTCCGITVKRGILGVSVRKMKALTVNMETVTLTGTGRWNMTCFVY
jgi:hypothetical protein